MSTFRIQHGQQTFDSSSTKVVALAMDLPSTGRDDGKWADRKAAAHIFGQEGRSSTVQASTDGYSDHGHWYKRNLMEGNGKKLLTIQVTRTLMGGAVRANCVIMLIPSPQAPKINVKVHPTAHRLSVVGDTLSVFYGRAFVVSPAEVKQLGVYIPNGIQNNLLDEEEVEEEFTVDNMDSTRQSTKLTTIEVSDGEGGTHAVVTQPMRGRRVRVRPKR